MACVHPSVKWNITKLLLSVDFLLLFLRDSKRKLEELLQQWSQWHAQNCSSANVVIFSLEWFLLSFLGVGWLLWDRHLDAFFLHFVSC